METYKEIKRIYDRANKIVASDLDWGKKYDLIFSDDISKKVRFNYYDPDTSYREDVLAFMDGFDEYIKDVEKLKDIDEPEAIGKSYHDVTVVVDGNEYNLFNSGYGLSLECCRVAGWQLWDKWNPEKEPRLIGGEYNNNKEFKILINGVIICESSKLE